MSRYFLDTEFLEGTQKSWFGKTKPTIDLISIGIVAEDGREFYAISKDFNLKEAWNRFQLERQNHPFPVKKYWIRDNVLFSIYCSFISGDGRNIYPFTYSTMQMLLSKYGKTNKEIAEEIKIFCKVVEKECPDNCHCQERVTCYECDEVSEFNNNLDEDVQFYAYFADYDWVVFCWLFGKMIDLPKGFSWYCNDLKQTLDEKATQYIDYPKQVNEHNALADARWNFELYKFLQKL